MAQVFIVLLKPELPLSLRQAFDGYLESWNNCLFLVCTAFSQEGFFVQIDAVKKGTEDTDPNPDKRTAYVPYVLVEGVLELKRGDKEKMLFSPGFL